MSYELVRFGFALLTIGLLVGSVWAKSAWGDFWVWVPKENWSLVTWLVYGGYLHLRRVRGWRGDKGAWLLIAGFAVVMFTYLGMHLLPTAEESAHVYPRSSRGAGPSGTRPSGACSWGGLFVRGVGRARARPPAYFTTSVTSSPRRPDRPLRYSFRRYSNT